MKQKNWVYYSSITTASVLTSLLGLITLEFTSFAAYIQQPSQSKNSQTINPISENFSTHQDKNHQPINTTNKFIIVNVPTRVSLQENMPYREARQLLLRQGWRPNLQGEPPNLQSYSVKELFNLGFTEIKDCAGTGEGPCRFEFINNKGELLVIVATTRGYENTKRFVKRWWIEKNSNITQQSSANRITEGLYWLGNTGQGLEVKGQRYRYYDESGEKPWQPISKLRYITNGVVFDGQNYWCLSTLAPRNKPATCSAQGWTQETLPFVGTRFFNFLGGSGTGQSITIQNNGRTIVKLHGTANTSVEYDGKFSNPLILQDGFGLLIKNNRIYQLGTDRQITRGCKGAGTICESELYKP